MVVDCASLRASLCWSTTTAVVLNSGTLEDDATAAALDSLVTLIEVGASSSAADTAEEEVACGEDGACWLDGGELGAAARVLTVADGGTGAALLAAVRVADAPSGRAGREGDAAEMGRAEVGAGPAALAEGAVVEGEAAPAGEQQSAGRSCRR